MRFEENGNSVRGVNSDPSIVERARACDRAARLGGRRVERDTRELREEGSIVGGGVTLILVY